MLMETKKRAVIIGGGTGLSTLIRGLKQYPLELTAIVTVADDGGSSGRLRDDYDIPPPGDVRNVIAAMLNAVVVELLSHTVRPSLDTGTGAGAVIFISWRDGGTGTQQQCTWNK